MAATMPVFFYFVMAGLDPAIHVSTEQAVDVDGRLGGRP
jgi:hypothetical protein